MSDAFPIRIAGQRAAKTPEEVCDLTFDFSARLATGETLTTLSGSAEVVLDHGSGLLTVVGSPTVNAAGTVVVQVSGGVAQSLYLLRVRVNTSTSQILEGVGPVAVEDGEGVS